MWPSRRPEFDRIKKALADFSANQRPLPGIADPDALDTLAMQMVASCRRLDFTRTLASRDIHPNRADPNSPIFEPERGAIYHLRQGNFDEAIWLTFLATHFGNNGEHGWRMLKDVYSGLGKHTWTWLRVSKSTAAFTSWLRMNHDKISGAFGNHRKYETLAPASKDTTANVISSFVQCCGPSPAGWFASLTRTVGNDPEKIFDAAYRGMKVRRFGRLGKFDYLALVGRLGLAPLSPASAYLKDATGPKRGARLLIDGTSNSRTKAADLEKVLLELDAKLGVGMQVMEDSLCNWQKSPRKFVHFKG